MKPISEKRKELICEILGESIHTAFRKATDCSEAMPIHRLISKMNDRDWRNVIDFVFESVKPFIKIIG